MAIDIHIPVTRGIGSVVRRPDAEAKVTGAFEFSTDAHRPGMLWGATVRSPHARAVIADIDTVRARSMPGVRALLTAADIPGDRMVGLIEADQEVLAATEVTHVGQPVVVVAADDPEAARLAAEAVVIDWEHLDPVLDPEVAIEKGDLHGVMRIRRGDPGARGCVVVEGSFDLGSQDQAPLGTESGIAVPDGIGGLDLYATSQWIHDDHRQLVAVLGMPDEALRVHPVGMGGAFGAREDLSVNAHLCLLALATGKPVKMVLDRSESFLAHVHRHPARLQYRVEADGDGTLVRLEGRFVIDGGAYMSSSPAVNEQVAALGAGPYRYRRVEIDAFATRTNNPPAGAMRGFGAFQVCYGYEAMMDRLAEALGLDPAALRRKNVLTRGEPLSTTGQTLESSFPSLEVLDQLAAMPIPDVEPSDDPIHLPGGTGLTTSPDHIRRGVGIAVGLKNIAYGSGFDDRADALVRIGPDGAEVHTAAMEVGQGLVVTLAQIARTALGMDRVEVIFDHTGTIGSAGSSSASRQTQVSGGAVLQACTELRHQVLDRFSGDRLDDEGAWRGSQLVADLERIAREPGLVGRARFRPPATEPPDADGQGRIHAELAVFAGRAVVDVDPELGLVRVVSLEIAQDVGRIINPVGLVGQVEGGAAQGLGFALMEGLVVRDGRILNASFTDYLIPTTMDVPDVRVEFVEDPSAWGPFGAKGAGEPPAIAAGPAIAAAIRDATGLPVSRFPIRPEDVIVGG